MEEIPIEFSSCSKYLIVAESVHPYNRVVSLVFTHIFVESCTAILSTTKSPVAIQYLENFQKQIPPFPKDGPEETKYFADDLFDAISSSLRSGKINTKAPLQLWLCSILYSVLDGNEAAERETICKISAAKLRKLVLNGKIRKALNNVPLKLKLPSQLKKDILMQNDNNELAAHQNVPQTHDPSQSQPQTAQAQPQSQISHTQSPPQISHQQTQPQKPDLNTILANYNENDVRNYMRFLGVEPPMGCPKVMASCKSIIQMNLDLCYNFLNRGDTKDALRYLKAIERIWRTGKLE